MESKVTRLLNLLVDIISIFTSVLDFSIFNSAFPELSLPIPENKFMRCA